MGITAQIKEKYIPKENTFYCYHYHQIILVLMFLLVFMAGFLFFVMHQLDTRPKPAFNAIDPANKALPLVPFDLPNLLPDTILRWASKAAVLSYTFDFVNYNAQAKAARPYFTELGWSDYVASLEGLVNNIIQNRLILNSVVSGTPVISNQGPIPGQDYAWRIQMPFLVSYVTAQGPIIRNYLVSLTVVRVPTALNPQGIGIDQFVMVRI